jgi:hypothetical protein
MIVLPLFAILGITLFLIKKKFSLRVAPMLAISIVIFVEYLFAVSGNLSISKFLIIPVGFFLLIKFIIDFDYKKLDKREVIYSLPYLLYLLPFFILINAVGADYRFTLWDEFSFWGTSVKYMHLTGDLYSVAPADLLSYRHYPPAQQLVHYFFTQFGEWSEPPLLKIQLFLVLSVLMSCFSVERKYLWIGALAFAASTSLMYYFHYQFHNIYADIFLTFYFAATAILILTSTNSPKENFSIGLALFVLVQIKVTGIIFAIVLVPMLLIKSLASQMQWRHQELIWNPVFLTKRHMMHVKPYSFAALLLHISVIALSYLSWSSFLSLTGIASNPKLPSLIKYFEDPLASKLISATHLFLIRLNETCFTFPIKLYQLIALLGFISITITLIGAIGSKKIRDSLIFLTFPAACIFYFLFLLFSYITFFSDFEGYQLYGIERYSATFLIAWLIIIFSNAISNYLESRSIRYIAISFSLLVLLIAPPKEFYSLITNFTLNEDSLKKRDSISHLAFEIEKLPPNSKIYFISQGSNGYENRVFQYSILPRSTSSFGKCISFGKPYHLDDIYTCDVDFINTISQSDYLAIHFADRKFWDLAGKYLDTNSKQKSLGIYKIVKAGGKVKLTEQ